jgi:hypothetical protein
MIGIPHPLCGIGISERTRIHQEKPLAFSKGFESK